MSAGSSSHDVVELSIRFRGLSINVSGPSAQAAQFVTRFALEEFPENNTGIVGEPGSFAEEGEESSDPFVFAGETRAEVESTFAACPNRWCLLASRLGGSVETARRRVLRAWRAGQWARAILDGRVPSGYRSEPLAIRSRVFVVLRADSLSGPACFQSSRSYWAAVGPEFGDSVSHSFPSELEARVYCDSAGVAFPTPRP